MSYDNTNRGVLFKNKDKEPDDNRPNYKGRVDVNGTEYWIDAWIRESKDGDKFMSLSVSPKDKQRAPEKPAQNKRRSNSFDDMP